MKPWRVSSLIMLAMALLIMAVLCIGIWKNIHYGKPIRIIDPLQIDLCEPTEPAL